MPARRLVLPIVAAMLAALVAAPALAAPGDGQLYVVHGVPGVTADVLVDGAVVASGVQAQAIVGPFTVAPGDHEVSLRPASGAPLSARVPVGPSTSLDVVAHRQADPSEPPVITVFPNDLGPVSPGKARVVVAHTAAVPPADIRVDQAVLFSNVANAESLSLVVPAGTYSVDIVPTGTPGPVVFGPVDLPISAGTLTRVFAFGDPAAGTMNAAVQSLPVATRGAGEPATVATGDGGQAALLADRSTPALVVLGAWLLAALVLALLLRRLSLRRS